MGVWIEIFGGRNMFKICSVTPFMGVWIEILNGWGVGKITLVTPFMGVWIEIASFWPYGTKLQSHSLYGSVDWNPYHHNLVVLSSSHSLYGSVDWNRHRLHTISNRQQSLPLWECGLKCLWLIFLFLYYSHSLYGSVDWNFECTDYSATKSGHSLYGSVDWNHDLTISLGFFTVTPFMGVWIEIICKTLFA